MDSTQKVEKEKLTISVLDREEIRERRRENRRIKAEEKKRLAEQQKSNQNQQKSIKTSEKLKIISAEDVEKFTAASSSTSSGRKTGKYRRGKLKSENFNLLEFVVEKEPAPAILTKRIPSPEKFPSLKLNKGKKREIPKKKHPTRLKRVLLENRIIRKSSKLENLPCIEQLKEEENSIEEDLKNNPLSNDVKKTDDEIKISNRLGRLSLDQELPNKNVSLHSRRFRQYCNNFTSEEICHLTEHLLRELFRFQKRAYEKNEIKARAHRRFVAGFKEVQRQLLIEKLKLVIIAPDCEPCDTPGGTDSIIESIKAKCENCDIPYLFSIRRRQLGYVLYKKVPVNCVGILNYDGAHEIFKELIKCLGKEREEYNKVTSI